MSLEALSERAGCAKSYLSEIENDRRAGPPGPDVLKRIEAALKLPEGTLLDMAAWARTPKQVREHVEELESRDRVVRRLVDLISGRDRGRGSKRRELSRRASTGISLDAAYKSGDLQRLIEAIGPHVDGDHAGDAERGAGRLSVREALPREVPIINSVAAGYPTEFTDLGYPARFADEYVRAPDLDDPDAFAARVVGDSMLPEYREGDIVIFSPLKPVKSGMDCFVRLERDHESTFKRVFFQEKREARGRGARVVEEGEWIRLQPLNPAFAVRVVHREEVAGMYAAVSVTRTLG